MLRTVKTTLGAGIEFNLDREDHEGMCFSPARQCRSGRRFEGGSARTPKTSILTFPVPSPVLAEARDLHLVASPHSWWTILSMTTLRRPFPGSIVSISPDLVLRTGVQSLATYAV